MKLSTTSSVYETDKNKFFIDFRQMHEDGYDGFDYQEFIPVENFIYKMSEPDFLEYMTAMKTEAARYGLSCIQLHGAWMTDDSTAEKREESLFYYRRSIWGASLLGCPNVVIHHRLPGETVSPEDYYEFSKAVNVEFLKKLMPDCEKYGVCLCLENLPFKSSKIFDVSGTLDIIRSVGNEHLKMCLDTGHLNVWGRDKMYERLTEIGDLLACVHIHDNRGDDTHCLPFFYNVDFKGFVKGLQDIRYTGALSTEPMLPHDVNEGIRRAHQVLLAEIIKYINELVMQKA